MEFQLPPLLLLLPLGGAVVVYAFLRFVVWAPRIGASAATASQHALWVGIIGWMASSLQGAVRAGTLPGTTTASAPSTPPELLQVLGWPVLATLAVHAIGQLSYPAPRQARRHAELAVRRIRDFLPRRLAWTTAGIFVFAAGTILWTSALPGFAPMLPGPQPVSPMGGPTGGYGRDGRIPGVELAAWLGGSLIILATGTCLVLWLIARRRQLETLDGDDNRALRTIAMNRLLRTTATIAAGLASVAGNYSLLIPPGITPESMVNVPVIVNIVVLLTMWRWPAGELPSLKTASGGPRGLPFGLDRSAHPAARLSASIGAGLAVVAALPIVGGLFFIPAIQAAGIAGPPAMVALVTTSILLAITAGELVMMNNYGTPKAPVNWPLRPVSSALLSMAIIGASLLGVAYAFAVAGQQALRETPGWTLIPVFSAAVLAAAAAAFVAVRFRRGVPGPDDATELDAALRFISVQRIVRTLAAYSLFQAGLLLMSTVPAWNEVFPVLGNYGPHPAILAGALVAAGGIILAVIPVRGLLDGAAGPQRVRTGTASQ